MNKLLLLCLTSHHNLVFNSLFPSEWGHCMTVGLSFISLPIMMHYSK